MWIHYYTFLYGYGILFTLVSCGFCIHDYVTAISGSSAKRWFKLVFSICTGWLLVIIVLGANGLEPAANRFMEIVYTLSIWIFPIIFFVGLEMIIYGWMNRRE